MGSLTFQLFAGWLRILKEDYSSGGEDQASRSSGDRGGWEGSAPQLRGQDDVLLWDSPGGWVLGRSGRWIMPRVYAVAMQAGWIFCVHKLPSSVMGEGGAIILWRQSAHLAPVLMLHKAGMGWDPTWAVYNIYTSGFLFVKAFFFVLGMGGASALKMERGHLGHVLKRARSVPVCQEDNLVFILFSASQRRGKKAQCLIIC